MWSSLLISDDILKSISELGFEEPTPIQRHVLPLAIRDYADILGSAPTGSGKTLAYGVPLLMRAQQYILKLEDSKFDRSVEDFTAKCKKSENSTKKTKKKGVKQNKKGFFNTLSLIEELDPVTMKVVRVHNIDDPEGGKTHDEPRKFGRKLETESVIDFNDQTSRILGLVILPTRELALQVTEHLRCLAKYMEPHIRIQAIVGGISIQKQTRLLERRPEVVVATPGRLWEFLQKEHPYIATIERVSLVVFDEADRLVESNHFAELRSILKFLRFGNRRKNVAILSEQEIVPSQNRNNVEQISSGGKSSPSVVTSCNENRRQTFVFSATLTFVHNNALMPGARATTGKKKKHEPMKMDTSSKLGFLRDMLGLSLRAKVIDLSHESTDRTESLPINLSAIQESKTNLGVRQSPVGLKEFRLACPTLVDKDVYLLWFLLIGRLRLGDSLGRCLIFLNSKSGVRRLSGVLRQCAKSCAFTSAVNVLHADMMQKQRFRSIERFQASESGIILATDVAARGLDFANTKNNKGETVGVSWVVHFDVPRTAEIYIHRCGRTARAKRNGVSVLMIDPSESVRWKKVLHNLSTTGVDLPDFQPTPTTDSLKECKQIVRIMRDLDQVEHTASKKAADHDWFKKSAEAADILLDSDLDPSDSDSELPSKKRRKTDKSILNLRRNMNALIEKFRRKIQKFEHS